MSRIRTVFLGTPDFAVSALDSLLMDEHFDIVCVITQPDRPSGRKMQLKPSPVKSFALSKGLSVISPESINTDDSLELLKKAQAEIAVVVAYGQIMSQKFLQTFPLGAVNVHGSLLPKWRGAAPIQRAIEAGDSESGVTLQKMVKKLDAGDLLGLRKITITDAMTAKDLHDEMARLQGELLHVELMDYIRGNLMPQPQNEALVTYAHKIDKAESEIQWDQPALKIHNKVKAFVMGPGTWTTYCENSAKLENDPAEFIKPLYKKLKIHKTSVIGETQLRVNPITQLASAPNVAGTILHAEGSELWVACGTPDDSSTNSAKPQVLRLLEVQPESRDRMSIADFIKGYSIKAGDRLGLGLSPTKESHK